MGYRTHFKWPDSHPLPLKDVSSFLYRITHLAAHRLFPSVILFLDVNVPQVVTHLRKLGLPFMVWYYCRPDRLAGSSVFETHALRHTPISSPSVFTSQMRGTSPRDYSRLNQERPRGSSSADEVVI